MCMYDCNVYVCMWHCMYIYIPMVLQHSGSVQSSRGVTNSHPIDFCFMVFQSPFNCAFWKRQRGEKHGLLLLLRYAFESSGFSSSPLLISASGNWWGRPLFGDLGKGSSEEGWGQGMKILYWALHLDRPLSLRYLRRQSTQVHRPISPIIW